MFPFLASRYLRTYRDGDRVMLDHPACGKHVALSELELDVLSAYWPPRPDDRSWAALVDRHGEVVAERAVMDLAGERVLVPDRATDEAALDEALERGMPPVPFVDQVELTNHCPMTCGFCPRGVEGGVTRDKGFMDVALFEGLVEQLPKEQALCWRMELHHLGESLLHPEVVRFVRVAAGRGIPTEMSVNPSHLRPDIARGLIDSGIGRLVLSLDGMDEATLSAARGPAASFKRAERNIDALFSMLVSATNPPQVIVQMLRLHRNRAQREAFLARYGSTGLPTVQATVKDLEGPDPELGEATCDPPSYLCISPWRSVVVLWDGRVVPCCRDADARLVLGDLRHQTLESIWHGPAAARLRELHRSNVRMPDGHLCSNCPWSRVRFGEAAPARHPRESRRDPYAW